MKKATTTGASAKPTSASAARSAPEAAPKSSGTSSKPAAPRTAKPASAAPAPKSAAAVPARTTLAAPASAPKKATLDSRPSTKVATTTVVAKVDVGFGNLLYIRGDGPGLSWDRGVPLECMSSDSWTWSTSAASRPFAYKVLVNDEQWSSGDDYVAAVGVENTVQPEF